MHENYDLKQEQLNKASLLSSKKFLEDLLEIFSKHVVSNCFLFFASFVLRIECLLMHCKLYFPLVQKEL